MEKTLVLAWAFETPKPTPNDILPPTMSYLLIVVFSDTPYVFKSIYLWRQSFFNKFIYLFILHPSHNFLSFPSQSLPSNSSLPPVHSPPPLFRKMQTFHQQNIAYQFAVRLRTSPLIKAGQGKSVRGIGSQRSRKQSKNNPCSHC